MPLWCVAVQLAILADGGDVKSWVVWHQGGEHQTAVELGAWNPIGISEIVDAGDG